MKLNLKLSGLFFAIAIGIMGCGPTRPPKMSEGHIKPGDSQAAEIPAAVTNPVVVPRPEPRPHLETYTVIVNQVPVRELLFSMARDAKLNLDIDNNIEGVVTMNAIDQTLPKILDRLASQVAITYKIEDGTLHVMADVPYLQMYEVNYLNMSRVSNGKVGVSTSISSTGSGASGGNSTGGGSKSGNNSDTTVENTSENNFWQTLTANVANIIGENVK